jgi:hypothetical protein
MTVQEIQGMDRQAGILAMILFIAIIFYLMFP